MCGDADDVPSCLTMQGEVGTEGCADGYWYSQDEFNETPVTEVSDDSCSKYRHYLIPVFLTENYHAVSLLK